MALGRKCGDTWEKSLPAMLDAPPLKNPTETTAQATYRI